MTDLPRITTAPDFPGQATIYLPDYTYWDTQAGACEVGVPVELLAGLRDAIDGHLGGRTTPDNPVASSDEADNGLREQYAAAIRETDPDALDDTAADDILAAVLAVRDDEFQQLRADQEQYEEQVVGTFNEQAIKLARRAETAEAKLAAVRRLHDTLTAETDLTSPDDEITRGAAAERIAAALDGTAGTTPLAEAHR